MKLLLLLAFAGLAVSASLRADFDISSSKTLVYQYDAQVGTGIEEVSDQFSTVRMRFRVLMRPDTSPPSEAGAQRWKVVFQTVNIRQRNNATESLPTFLQPMRQFRNLENSDLWMRIEPVLKKPFVVVMNEKELSILKVQFDEQDPFWSVNLKKGFLNMLNVNFLPNEASSSSEMRFGQWSKEANEMTTAARCKTQYSAQRLQFHEASSQIFKVSKAIDFNSCVNPLDGRSGLAGVWVGLHHSDPLPQQQEQKQLLEPNNMGEYLVQMSSDNRTPVIRKASTKTIYTWQPFKDSRQGTKKTIAIQKLELKDVTDAEDIAIDTSSMQEKPEGLRLIFPEEAREVNREAVKNEVVRLLQQLLKSGDEIDLQVYEQILRFLRFHLNEQEQLRSIAQELMSEEKSEKLLRIFIADICPQIGSHGSAQFLMQVVRQLVKETTPWEFVTKAKLNVSHITVIFAKLSMLSKVQLKTLKLVHDTIRSSSFKSKMLNAERMPIFTSAWLSLGAMVNVYYSRQGGVEPYLFPIQESQEAIIRLYQQSPWQIRQQHAVQSKEFREAFVSEIREALQKQGVTKTIALKVIKNCGLFELRRDLGEIFMKRLPNQSVNDRVLAVYATQKMLRRHTLPRTDSEDPRVVLQQQKFIIDHQEYIKHFDDVSRKIQAELIACFKNVREDPEVRIACYRVLMQSPIKQTTLNMLMQVILSDPTQQVNAYCLQHMQQIAKRPLPRYRSVSKTVRSVLSMIERRQGATATSSRVFHAQMLDQLHDMGITLETDMILSDKSFTPRWTHIRLDHQFMGRNLPLLEIAVRTEGLQQMLEKIMGPHGKIYSSSSFMKLLRRATRSLSESITIDEDLLDIVPRILKEMPNIDLTISLMGYDTIFVKTSRQVTDSLISMKGQSLLNSLKQLKGIFQPLVRSFTMTGTYQLPTTVGSIFEMNCLLNFDFKPKMQIDDWQQTDKRTKLMLLTQIPLTVQGFNRFGNNMYVLNHFYLFDAKMEMNKESQFRLGFDLNRQDSGRWLLTLLHWSPKGSEQLLKFNNKAVCSMTELCFCGGRAQTTTSQTIMKPKRIIKPTRVNNPNPMVNDILKFFGIQLSIQGQHFSNENLFQAPCSVLMGPSEYTIAASSVGDNSVRSVIKHQIVLTFPVEKLNVPQVQVQVNQVSLTDIEATIKQIAKLQFRPKAFAAKSFEFDCQLQSFIGDRPSFSIDAALQLPQDLRMMPRSLPLRASEWIVDRQLRVNMRVKDEKEGADFGTVRITLSTNNQLLQILKDSSITQQQMLNMFPLLVQCLNETTKSINEEPLNANPLFTPSCVRQFKKFNQLSAMKVQLQTRTPRSLLRDCRICKIAMRQLKVALFPYLVQTSASERSSDPTFTVDICPSPLDSRVVHLNMTCPWKVDQWRSIQLPFTPFAWDSVDPVVTSVVDFFKGDAAKCKLMNSHVRTFDNVIYSIPKTLFSKMAENSCPVLLARDCSTNKEFQVLANIKDGKKYITVQLQTDNRPFAIELSKPIESEQMKSTVKVNGRTVAQEEQELEESQQEQEIMNRSFNTRKGKMTVVISSYQYAGTVMYKIRSLQQQLEVLIGGPKLRTVEIRASPFYHNKMCGLCGDYNSEKFREFKAPNYHQVMASAAKMTQQYVLPISRQCQVVKDSQLPEDWEDKLHFGAYDLIEKPSWNNYDLPARRPSCVIDNSQMTQMHVKTFKHAEIELLSPAVSSIVRQTPCSLKMAVADIKGQKALVYIKQNRVHVEKVIVKIGSFEQELSAVTPTSSERSLDSPPSGIAASLESIGEDAVKFRISKDEDSLTVTVTNKRVVIKANKIDSSEKSVCELTHSSQLQLQHATVLQFLNSFTNQEHDAACREQLQRNVAQCRIAPEFVEAYHQADDYTRPQVNFLNDRLIRQLATTNAPLVLSVERNSDDESTAYSVQMVVTLEDNKPVRHILLKKNQQILVKVTKPPTGSATIFYVKDGRQQQIDSLPAAATSVGIDNDFELKMQSNKVEISHTKNLYEISIDLTSSIPVVSIVRPYHHDSYSSTGACQINKVRDIMTYQSNPKAVLQLILKNSLSDNRNSEAKIFTDSEVAKLQRIVSEQGSSDFEVLEF